MKENAVLLFSCLLLIAYFYINEIEEKLSEIMRKEKIKVPEKAETFQFRETAKTQESVEGEVRQQKIYEKRLPDFIIIGMQKCGTTALKYYLGIHPNLLAPDRGEIHFFEKDTNFNKVRKCSQISY